MMYPITLAIEFKNFFDVATDYLNAIWGILLNLGSDAVMLIRLAYGFVTVPPLLSLYFLAPIAVSGFVMVIVGIVKIIFGRQAQ